MQFGEMFEVKDLAVLSAIVLFTGASYVAKNYPVATAVTVDTQSKLEDHETAADDKNGVLSIQVLGFRIATNQDNQNDWCVEYYIAVCRGSMPLFSIWRRYSAFRKVHSILVKAGKVDKRIQFPRKHSMVELAMGMSYNRDYLEQRRKDLHNYLGKVITSVASFDSLIVNNPALKEFFIADATDVYNDILRNYRLATNSANRMGVYVEEALDALREVREIAVNASGQGTNGWELYKTKGNLSCYLKRDNGMTFAMGAGIVDASPQAIFELLCDASKRPKYDPFFKQETIIEQISLPEFEKEAFSRPSASDCLQNLSFKTAVLKRTEFYSPAKLVVGERDTLCVSVSALDSKDGTYYVAARSVEDDRQPPCSEYVRAEVLTAGYVLRRVEEHCDKCHITSVGRVDAKGNIPQWVINQVAPKKAFGLNDMVRYA